MPRGREGGEAFASQKCWSTHREAAWKTTLRANVELQGG
jgi:hypothetical protein